MERLKYLDKKLIALIGLGVLLNLTSPAFTEPLADNSPSPDSDLATMTAENPAVSQREKIVFLGGYKNTPECEWFIRAKEVLESENYNIEMVNIPPEDIPNRQLLLEKTDQAVMESEGEIIMVGFSQGGGAEQMYLNKYNPVDQDGNRKIKRAIFISSRDLLDLNMNEVPPYLKSFYLRIDSPSRILGNANEFRVAYGLRDRQVLPHNGAGLARRLGVDPIVFDMDHGGIIDNPWVLLSVIK